MATDILSNLTKSLTPKRHKKARATSKRKSTRRKSASKSKRGSKSYSSKSYSSKSYGSSGGSGTACITGNFDGQIQASGDLRIAPGAKCNANLKAKSVQIDGDLKGAVTAKSQMKLGRNAKIRGDIVADRLIAADGACFEGTVKLGRRAA
jgi:cytoskeletal protein CcmA (bactofilin family)